MRKVGFLTIVCILSFFVAPCQRLNVINYNQSNGLPSNQINDLIQDRNGLIWIATMSGVITYDGKSFSNMDNCPDLTNNPVKSIYQDLKGNLWFGTIRKGLFKFTGTKFTEFNVDNGLPNDVINVITGDEKNGLWIGTNDGLSHFDGIKFVNYNVKNGLPSNIVFDIETDKSGKVWIATANGVAVLMDGKFINYSSGVAGFNSNIVYCIEKISDDEICFGTYDGLSILKDDHFTNFTNFNGGLNNRVDALYFDRQGVLWIGTYGGGLIKKTGDVFESVKLSEAVNGRIITSIINDREGNFWIGSWMGIYKYDNNRFITFNAEDGLENNNILSIYYDDQFDQLLMGTLAGGLNFIKDGKVLTNALNGNSVWSIKREDLVNIWLGTTNGPALYNSKTNEFTYPLVQLQNTIVYAIEKTKSGIVYFGTDKGLYKYSNNQLYLINAQNGLSNESVRAIYEDENNVLWVGTMKGTFQINNDNAVSFNDLFKIKKSPITSITSDGKGAILIGSYDLGLIAFDDSKPADQKVQIVDVQRGLSNNKVLFTMFENEHYLWVGTTSGIDRLDWKRFNNSGQIAFNHLNKSNGYNGVETNAATKDKSGNIWLGSVNGAIRFNPNTGFIKTTLPSLSISKVQLFFENVDWSKMNFSVNSHTGLPVDLILNYADNNLNFVCSGVYLTAPEELRYRYYLEGFDQHWSPLTKSNFANYSNIPPGNYVFKVQATANGYDYTMPVTFAFEIKPPFYKTIWAYIFYVVSITSAIVFSYRYRTRSLRKAKEILEGKVEDRTKELQEKNSELEKLSLVASETDNAIMIFDANQKLEWVNAGFEKLTEFSLFEFKQSRGDSLKDISSNKEVSFFLNDIITEKKSIVYESEIRSKSGKHFWLSSTLTPIFDENNELKNIVVIETDITLRKKMEEQIKGALEEKGLLLREIHHRVKNNLQIIISLFNLQTSYIDDEKAFQALKEGQDRIKSMALIHERFYQSDGISKIDFDEYARKLVEHLYSSFKINQGKIMVDIQVQNVQLDIDTAVPCGLIINEIVSNAFKHAFVGLENGTISLLLKNTSTDNYYLEIKDDGVGMPADFNIENSDSLGFQLIQALTDQLDGKLELVTSPSKGLTYKLNFKNIS
ncbi:MAG: two-component regulator propeller domain-containing protein [Bacteroidota bacterium]